MRTWTRHLSAARRPMGDFDKPPAISLATMERASKLCAGDAVKMQLDAQQRRQAADHMQERDDRIGSRYELGEAKRLEHKAELILDHGSVHGPGAEAGALGCA